jgi:acetoacetyl-CoA synthetase
VIAVASATQLLENVADDTARSERLVTRLVGIWERVLQNSPILPDSDFFDLGGDSLLAMNLLLEVEHETGVSLPVTTIYDAPTVLALANLLIGQRKQKFSPLVLLKEGTGGAPLFIVHGIGGTVFELSRLGKHIRHDGSIYAIQAKGIDGEETPLATIEGMAEYYLDAIREVQPEGPYFLSGYSFGGLVAVEIARRLERQHESIGALVLIDAYAHPSTWTLWTRSHVMARKLWHRGAEFARQPLRATTSRLLQKCRDLFRHRSNLRNGTASGKTVRRWLRQLTINLPPELQRVYAAGEEALDSYVPRFYAGKIAFIKAQTTDLVFPPNPLSVWKRLVRDVELYSVPGDHVQLVTEYCGVTAERLSDCLKQSRGARASIEKTLPAAQTRSFFSRLRAKYAEQI